MEDDWHTLLLYVEGPISLKQEFGEALLVWDHSDNPEETSIPTQGNHLGECTVLRNKDSDF